MMILHEQDLYDKWERMCFYCSKDNRKVIYEVNNDFHRLEPVVLFEYDFEQDITKELKAEIDEALEDFYANVSVRSTSFAPTYKLIQRLDDVKVNSLNSNATNRNNNLF